MKGFVRILEALIASIVLFTSISFFFGIFNYSLWDDAIIKTQTQDAVTALYFSNDFKDSFYRNDKNIIVNGLSKMLPSTTEYSVEANGVPSPEIRIHCVCNATETQRVENNYLPSNIFIYNNRNINILMNNDLDLNEVDRSTDIILFLDFNKMRNERARIDSWLANGRNVMLLANLQQADFTSDTNKILEEAFGLTWNGGSNDNVAQFAGETDVTKVSYRIAKYFEGSSIYTSGENFDFDSTNKIGRDANTIISSSLYSFVKVNENIGRTTWFADYDATSIDDETGIPVNDNINKLLRSTIMWSSGEKYRILDRTLPEIQPYIRYDFPGIVDSDPYQITILIWSVFF